MREEEEDRVWWFTSVIAELRRLSSLKKMEEEEEEQEKEKEKEGRKKRRNPKSPLCGHTDKRPCKDTARVRYPVAHACNPSYSGDRDQEYLSLKPASGNN
jgi:hypothetical protein